MTVCYLQVNHIPVPKYKCICKYYILNHIWAQKIVALVSFKKKYAMKFFKYWNNIYTPYKSWIQSVEMYKLNAIAFSDQGIEQAIRVLNSQRLYDIT